MSAIRKIVAPVAGLIVGIAGFFLISPAGGDSADCGWDAICDAPAPQD